MTRLAGKTAFVTGGASGLGEAIVRRFVAEGAQVIIADVDADTYGHMLELYSPFPALTDFYAAVADAARGWQGATR